MRYRAPHQRAIANVDRVVRNRDGELHIEEEEGQADTKDQPENDHHPVRRRLVSPRLTAHDLLVEAPPLEAGHGPDHEPQPGGAEELILTESNCSSFVHLRFADQSRNLLAPNVTMVSTYTT